MVAKPEQLQLVLERQRLALQQLEQAVVLQERKRLALQQLVQVLRLLH
jgi:hypothetical protein